MSSELETLELEEVLAKRDPETRDRLSPEAQSARALRVPVAAAFHNIGACVDAKTAFNRTKAWWRKAGGPGTKSLG